MTLLDMTLLTVAKESSINAADQEKVAKVPKVTKQLSEHALSVVSSVANGFETAFEDLPVTKEHRSKEKVQDVVEAVQTVHETTEKVQEKLQEVAQTVRQTQEIVQKAASTAAAVMSHMKKNMQT